MLLLWLPDELCELELGSCPRSMSSDLISPFLGAKADMISSLDGCVSLLPLLLPKMGVEFA